MNSGYFGSTNRPKEVVVMSWLGKLLVYYCSILFIRQYSNERALKFI